MIDGISVCTGSGGRNACWIQKLQKRVLNLFQWVSNKHEINLFKIISMGGGGKIRVQGSKVNQGVSRKCNMSGLNSRPPLV